VASGRALSPCWLGRHQLLRPTESVIGFYNQRGTAEQWIKEGKNAMKWTRLSCCTFAANAVRLQLHALAYNLANFMRTLALPDAVKHWSLSSLREKLVKIGAKIVTHARYVTFQMAEVAVTEPVVRGDSTADRWTATATGAGLRARIVQCIMPTGGACPNAKKNEANQLSERDFPALVR
jgi:Transposase DDE domain group 1